MSDYFDDDFDEDIDFDDPEHAMVMMAREAGDDDDLARFILDAAGA